MDVLEPNKEPKQVNPAMLSDDEKGIPTSNIVIPDKMFFRIGDVANILQVKPYVLRYWESEFSMLSPSKSNSGQRVYKRGDVETLVLIKHLLYEQQFSIAGARKKIRELRKSKELKSYKKKLSEDKTASAQDAKVTAKIEGAQKQMKDLQILLRTPIQDLFRV